MKRFWNVAAAGLAIAVGLAASAPAELKVGDAAPEFELKGSDGKVYRMSDLKGKQAVVIAWYPKAFTGGWTKECLSFRANGEAIREFNVAYFTASCDTVEDNTAFAKKLELDYPILSDPSTNTARAFGVLSPRGRPQRWTYIIGLDGKVKSIDKKVKSASHGEDIVKALEKAGIPKK